MNINTLLLAAVLAFQNLCDCPADPSPVPLIEETVDGIICVQYGANMDNHRLVFVRRSVQTGRMEILDDRYLYNIDSFVYIFDGDRIGLAWHDYGTCERVVWTNSYWEATADDFPELEAAAQLAIAQGIAINGGIPANWWVAGRNMRALKQP